MNEKQKKEQKKIKIWFIEGTVADFIFLGAVLLIVLLYQFLPKVYAVTTARYGNIKEKDMAAVQESLGTEATEENFLLYFQWYNVVHELGHGVIRYNGNRKISSVEEEQLANDFAVAYWLTYGDEEMIAQLERVVAYAAEHMKSDAEDEDYMEFGRKNWKKRSFFTFRNYGWFQFHSTRESLKNRKSLEEVLKNMGVKEFDLPAVTQKLSYPTITEEVSTQILSDAADNIRSWGLKFPEVHQKFSNDPNDNYSAPRKKLFSLILP